MIEPNKCQSPSESCTQEMGSVRELTKSRHQCWLARWGTPQEGPQGRRVNHLNHNRPLFSIKDLYTCLQVFPTLLLP